MSQSHAQVWIHIVFSTKGRRPLPPKRRPSIGDVSHVSPPRQGNKMRQRQRAHDHVHLLIGLARTITIAKLVEKIKSATSKWAKTANNGISTFQCQAGYGAFPSAFVTKQR